MTGMSRLEAGLGTPGHQGPGWQRPTRGRMLHPGAGGGDLQREGVRREGVKKRPHEKMPCRSPRPPPTPGPSDRPPRARRVLTRA